MNKNMKGMHDDNYNSKCEVSNTLAKTTSTLVTSISPFIIEVSNSVIIEDNSGVVFIVSIVAVVAIVELPSIFSSCILLFTTDVRINFLGVDGISVARCCSAVMDKNI